MIHRTLSMIAPIIRRDQLSTNIFIRLQSTVLLSTRICTEIERSNRGERGSRAVDSIVTEIRIKDSPNLTKKAILGTGTPEQ